jgi:hypothetical protein
MFEARVAEFYRSKGYEVHEKPKVRGASENVYAVPMVANGPMGALLVSFGDAGGIDGHEIGRARTMARDIGATPVIAVPSLAPDLRRLAAQMGVVILDESTVAEPGPLPKELPGVQADPMRRDLDAHPWPASGRAFSFGGPGVASARDVDELIADLHAKPEPEPVAAANGFAWAAPAATADVESVAAPVAKFGWLQQEAAPEAVVEEVAAEEPRLELPWTAKASIAVGTAFDVVRDWPWKTIVWTGVGAVGLIAVIRWLA